MKRTGPTNYQLQKLIQELKQKSIESEAAIWNRVARDLEKPTRVRRIINLYKIDKCAKEGETVIVPGKVLGTGLLNHHVRVAAFDFSKQALEKINQKGQAITIIELLKENPTGKNVRILG